MPTKTKKLSPAEIASKKIMGPVGRKYSSIAKKDNQKNLDEKDVLLNIEIFSKDKKIWYGEVNITLEEIKLVNIVESIQEKILVYGPKNKKILEICHVTGHTEMVSSLKRDGKGFIRKARDVKKIKNPVLDNYLEIRLPKKLTELLDKSKNPQNDSPLDIFWMYILGLKKLPHRPEGTKLNISSVYIHKNDYEMLRKSLEVWASIAYAGANAAKMSQAITWALVDCAPNTMSKELENHCQTNCLYIKKSEELWVLDAQKNKHEQMRSIIVDDRIPKTADGHIIH